MSTCKLWKIRFKMLRGECDCCLDDCCEENTNLVTSDDFIDSLVSIWIDFVQKFREIMSKHFRQKFIDFTKVLSFLLHFAHCTLYLIDFVILYCPHTLKCVKVVLTFMVTKVKSFFSFYVCSNNLQVKTSSRPCTVWKLQIVPLSRFFH